MEDKKDMNEIFNELDAIISSTDISKVTAEGSGFEELPEGYYLSEVEQAELTVSKNSGDPMVKFVYKVVEDGIYVDEDGNNISLSGTKNRKIFKYYVMKDGDSFKRFVTDMLKFENDEKPLLEKEMLMSSQLINDCLEVLIGMRIYIKCTVSENKDGTEGRWYSPTSWEIMNKLEIK